MWYNIVTVRGALCSLMPILIRKGYFMSKTENQGGVDMSASSLGNVELPFVLTTFGWQYEDIDLRSAKFSGLPSEPAKAGLEKVAVLSTDGGRIGDSPRVYLAQDYAPYDRADSLGSILSWLESIAVSDLEAELDGSLICGKWWFASHKFTMTKIDDHYVVTYYFVYQTYYGGKDFNPVCKVVYTLAPSMNLADVSVHGFLTKGLSEEVKKAIKTKFTDNITPKLRHAILVWKEIDKQLGINSKYLEVVLGATQFVMDGRNVRSDCFDGPEYCKFISGKDLYTPYIATAVMSPENGFSLDDGVVAGEHAVCVAI